MNTNNEWARTLLIAYKFLPRLCETVDRQVKELGYNSNCASSNMFAFCDINYVADKIVKLINKKIDYINLKILTEKAIKSINKSLAKILILKYVHQMKNAEIINILSLNARTFFRKIKMAEEAFKKELERKGYTFCDFYQFIMSDNFTKTIYETVVKNTNVVPEDLNKLKFINLKIAV